MAWYPSAIKLELQPESDQQAAIKPTQFIYHSIAAPWTAQRTYEFWRDGTNLESHFGLGFAGDLAQYIGTQTRADANYRANRRPDGTGAISLESASNLEHTDPWTDEQIPKLIDVGVWAHRTHAIPLRICRTWDDPGFGWHALHSEWSVSGTACPGAARIKQFKEIVFPGIVARANGSTEEEDMTPEQAKQLTDLAAAVKRIEAGMARKPWTYMGEGETRDAYSYLRDTERAVKSLGATGLTPAQSDALAKKVADLLAARLQA
jgi:hypothetical protein